MALEWIAAAIAKVNDTHVSDARPSEAGDCGGGSGEHVRDVSAVVVTVDPSLGSLALLQPNRGLNLMVDGLNVSP
jgi:hypothetical protein